MLNSQNLIDKICAKITGGGLTALQTCQMNGALAALCAPVCSVPTFNNLPSATDNLGRMIYVHAENRYYYAFGGIWLNDFQSTIYNYDDSLWSWGCASYGILGNNTTTSRSSPVSVVGGFTNWCQASAGGSFTMAVRSSGSAWAWGRNDSSQLGDNSAIDKSSPVSVVGGFTDWCQTSGGGTHTVALRTGGTAWSWGSNVGGTLGICTAGTPGRSSPMSVVGGFSDWCQASAGTNHSVAVRSSGSAWSWGCNSLGRLGDNTTTDRSSPVSVVGGFSDWCQVSAGGLHSVAVRTSGSAWSWGRNNYGQLGDNTTTSRSSPVSVVGGFSDWCQVSASGHTVAIRTSGSAWAWGYNGVGRLGDNTLTTRSSPVSVVGGFTNWCQVSAGSVHTVAVRTSGSAWAWGYNRYGRLGDNTVTSSRSPVSVVGGFTDWSQVCAGGAHTIAIRQEVKGF